MATNLTAKRLAFLQERFKDVRRPIPIVIPLQESDDIYKNNWKKLFYSPPTDRQLQILRRLHFDEAPKSRIDASTIIHDLTLLAYYEAGQLAVTPGAAEQADATGLTTAGPVKRKRPASR